MDSDEKLLRLRKKWNETVFKQPHFTEETKGKILSKLEEKKSKNRKREKMVYVASLSVPLLILVFAISYVTNSDDSNHLAGKESEIAVVAPDKWEEDRLEQPEGETVEVLSEEPETDVFRDENAKVRYHSWDEYTLEEQAEQIANITRFANINLVSSKEMFGITKSRATETTNRLLESKDPYLQALGKDLQLMVNEYTEENEYVIHQVAQDLWNYVFERRTEGLPTFTSETARYIMSQDIQKQRSAAAKFAYELHYETNQYVYDGVAKWKWTKEMIDQSMVQQIKKVEYEAFKKGLYDVLQSSDQKLLQVVGEDLDRAFQLLIKGYGEYKIEYIEESHNIVSDLNQQVFGGKLDDGPSYGDAEALNYLD
ncbi:hypothetical protein [Alkalihalobacillus deserti]|uniref:hypothetical protein n=1 Tax=Alkalihalobacillus deserti TaxID=2879466 RepID=UPI001D134971|nr:hypothetical protein [Alkalihalobacillus deserti]